jgi:hypothetical protein
LKPEHGEEYIAFCFGFMWIGRQCGGAHAGRFPIDVFAGDAAAAPIALQQNGKLPSADGEFPLDPGMLSKPEKHLILAQFNNSP